MNSVEAPATWLTMTPRNLPVGVYVTPVSATVIKEIDKTTNKTEVLYYERVRVTLKVTVESMAKPGAVSGARLLYSDGVQETELPFRRTIEKP